LALVDASLGGGGVEVVGVPCCVEGVGWVFGFVGGDGAVEFVLADVALFGVSVNVGGWEEERRIPRDRRCLKRWRC